MYVFLSQLFLTGVMAVCGGVNFKLQHSNNIAKNI